MFITNVLLVSGALYAYVKHRRKQTKEAIIVIPSNEAIGDTESAVETAERYTNIATISVSMSIVGTLVYPPLTFVSVPLNVYTLLPVFEDAFDTLSGDANAYGSIVSSIVIAGSLVTNHYLMANLFDWSVQRIRLGQTQLQAIGSSELDKLTEQYASFFLQALGQKPAFIWVERGGIELDIPFSELAIGDLITYQVGEVIVIHGEIVEGLAAVAHVSQFAQQRSKPTEKKYGDFVAPQMILLSGQIVVRVDSL